MDNYKLYLSRNRFHRLVFNDSRYTFAIQRKEKLLTTQKNKIMKTLDYLHMSENNANAVVNALKQLLADFQVHYTNLRGMHWHIEGRGFFVLHEKFESMYDDMASKIDEVAERILMLGATPENRFSEYLKMAKLAEATGVTCSESAVKHILDSYKYLIGLEKEALAVAEEVHDVVTADMLTGYIAEQEKMVWMLVAFSTHNCNK